MPPRIVLRGITGEVQDRVVESDALIRVGRLETLEVCVTDGSVSRRHGEVLLNDSGWQIRDLGSTNGTFLNGDRLTGLGRPVHRGDLLQFGQIGFIVERLDPEFQPEPDPELGITRPAGLDVTRAARSRNSTPPAGPA